MLKQECWIVCKYCGSEVVVKYGKCNEVQLYWCKSCRRKFKADDNAFRMKTPSGHVSAALDMYYEGSGVEAIRRLLQKEYGHCTYFATVYGWIKKYTQYALESIRDYHAEVGDIWVADETVLRIGGQNVWLWDIVDSKTRYLLASRVSTNRTMNDAERLMETAVKRSGKIPRAAVADKLKTHLGGMGSARSGDSEWGCGILFNIESNGALVKSYIMMKERKGIIWGHRHIESAVEFNEGWMTHYNFFKPHSALYGKTPAEAAGIVYPYKNWDAVIREYTPLVMGV